MSRAVTTVELWDAYRSEILEIARAARSDGTRAQGSFGADARFFGFARVQADGSLEFRWMGPSESSGVIAFDPDLERPRAVAA